MLAWELRCASSRLQPFRFMISCWYCPMPYIFSSGDASKLTFSSYSPPGRGLKCLAFFCSAPPLEISRNKSSPLWL